MRVEHLQQLDIRRQHGDQVAAVAALQLGGGQPAQRTKHFIADECQQFKGNKMVAALLGIVQHAARDGQHRQQQADRTKADGHAGQHTIQQRVSAQHRNENSAEEARHAQQHGSGHHGGQRFYQADQAAHHSQIAAGLVVHIRHRARPPFRNFPVPAAGSTGGRRCRPQPAGLHGCPALPACRGPARKCYLPS